MQLHPCWIVIVIGSALCCGAAVEAQSPDANGDGSPTPASAPIIRKSFMKLTDHDLAAALGTTNDPALLKELLKRFTAVNFAVMDARSLKRGPEISNADWQYFIKQCGVAMHRSHNMELRSDVLSFVADAARDDLALIQADIATCLDDSNEAIRHMAISVMLLNPGSGEAGELFFLPHLARALRHTDAATRVRAAFAMGQFGEAAASQVSNLIEALRDADEGVRFGAATSLGMIGPKAAPAVPKLVANLHDSFEPARYSAAEALGRIGAQPAEAVPALMAALHDASDMTRGHAAAALGRFGFHAESAIDELIKCLQADSAEFPRRAAAEGLGGIGSRAQRAIPMLIGASQGSNSAQLNTIVAALGQIGGEPETVVPFLVKAQDHKDWVVRCSVVDAFGGAYLQTAEALTAVQRGLNDRESIVAEHSIKVLERMGPRAAEFIPKLSELAQSAHTPLGRTAQYMLGKIQNEQTLQLETAVSEWLDSEK